MRFMMIVKANKDSEAGMMPSEELLAAMGKYNEELVKAGVMLDGAGLQSSSKGARVKFSGGKTTVIDGPFAETKELIAGYWIVDVRSKEEAIGWVKKIPFEEGEEIEIRKEFDGLSAEKKQIETLLASEAKQWQAIRWEVGNIRKRFGLDTEIGRRRTDFVGCRSR